MDKQDFDLHYYFAELQQEKQLVFFFSSRLEMQVSKEVYDLTLICTWNLPQRQVGTDHRTDDTSTGFHSTPLREWTHSE